MAELSLEDLRNWNPFISPGAVDSAREACTLCFDAQGHVSGVEMALALDNNQRDEHSIHWHESVTDQIRDTYRDTQKRVELGAVAMALLIVPNQVPYTVRKASTKGDHIDYYLVRRDMDSNLIFNDAFGLEVSGIARADKTNTVDGRVKLKAD